MSANSSHVIQRSGRRVLTLAMLGLIVGGCSQGYVTPGGAVAISSLQEDKDIAERMKREPAAPFPARIAVVRVQANQYRSYSSEGYGEGRYCVLTTRDIERDEDWQRLEKMPNVAGVALLNRMVIPSRLDSDKELRLAAASLKADVLLIYTIDTVFRIDEHDFGPMRLISLGMLPTKEARVTATASAGFFDVRTGYIYGLAEATALEKQIASSWTSEDAVDQSRKRAEQKAFGQLIGEIENTWGRIAKEYVKDSKTSAAG